MKKQLVRYFLIATISLLFLQLATLILFSESQKASTVINDIEVLIHIENVDSLAFNTNMSNNEQKLMTSLESRFVNTVEYMIVCDTIDWRRYRVDPNYLAIHIGDVSENPFIFEAKTGLGTLYYGESWYNKYIWVLLKWFKLEHECTGQS